MTKKKKRKSIIHINLGSIVFLVILVYLAAYIITYLGKEKLAVYEVVGSDITDTIEGTGVILRKEKLISTTQDGYVNYYVKDSSLVESGAVVYTLDTTGNLQSFLEKLLSKKEDVSSEEKDAILEKLRTYTETYTDDTFGEVYDAQNEIQQGLMSYTDTVIADNKEKIEKKYGEDAYVEVTTDTPGLVSFSSDGLEDLKEKNVTREIIKQGSKMQDLRTQELSEADTPVYRLVTAGKWKLTIPITEDEYNRLNRLTEEGTTTIQVTVKKDNFVTKAPFVCRKRTDGCYVTLSFADYVSRYVNQRFLSVELLLSDTEGLKIPSSALVNKEVYQIPVEFLTEGSNESGKTQVNLLADDGTLTQKTVSIYRQDEENAWIDQEDLKEGDVISDVGKEKTFTIGDTSKIQGVFVVNRGYAVFSFARILERNEDYCIISADESDVELYDRVILNSTTIKEGQVIY